VLRCHAPPHAVVWRPAHHATMRHCTTMHRCDRTQQWHSKEFWFGGDGLSIHLNLFSILLLFLPPAFPTLYTPVHFVHFSWHRCQFSNKSGGHAYQRCQMVSGSDTMQQFTVNLHKTAQSWSFHRCRWRPGHVFGQCTGDNWPSLAGPHYRPIGPSFSVQGRASF